MVCRVDVPFVREDSIIHGPQAQDRDQGWNFHPNSDDFSLPGRHFVQLGRVPTNTTSTAKKLLNSQKRSQKKCNMAYVAVAANISKLLPRDISFASTANKTLMPRRTQSLLKIPFIN